MTELAAGLTPRRIVDRVVQPPDDLTRSLGSSLLARLMAARGVQAPDDLARSMAQLLPPESLKGAADAADLLAQALLEHRTIVVAGDYDADGATSTALAVSTLRAFGAVDVKFLIPDRVRDGYGLSEALAERAAEMGAWLLCTVDNGITSVAGVARARALGVKVLVTDHHLPGAELPSADVIVNPNQPGCEFASKALAGVGVLFYVLMALRKCLRERGHFARGEPNLADGLDLVTLGTVADVVPLDRNNRLLVHLGLQRMRAGRCRAGIRALARVAKRTLAELTAEDIGFAIAPRINAAGRLADMSIGVRCLLAESDAEADALAAQLQSINEARRDLQQQMTQQALKLVEQLPNGADTALCLYDDSWHEGIVGIVAGRVRELSGRPTFAFAPSLPDVEGRVLLKGSGRSVPDLNLRDVLVAIDAECPGLMLRYGGHAMAAGVTLTPSRLDPFRAALNGQLLRGGAPIRGNELITDGALRPEECSLPVAYALRDAGPWGAGFPEPTFHNVFEVAIVRVLTPTFARIVMRAGDRVLEAVLSGSDWPRVGQIIDAVYRLGINRYGGRETLQLRLDHWQPATGS